MKFIATPTLLFSILAYALLCAAIPTSTPIPTTTLKLRVWNDPRSNPHYDGYVELHNHKVAYNNTLNYAGFNEYHDTPLTTPGTLRESSTGWYAALIPTNTDGLWSFKFIEKKRNAALTDHFRFLHQQCGNCGGQYLDYRSDINDLSPTSFLIGPAKKKGHYVFYYNNYTMNSNIPTGAYPISLLMDVFE